MQTFSENSLWTNVVKPLNSDYHVAEESNFSLSSANPFLVGDYVIEPTTGASGIVYEIINSTNINVSRDSSTLFTPSASSIGNGTSTVSYAIVTTTHGISNEVSQNLVDRTKWLYDNKAGSNTNITAGIGLTGGGNLTASRTISMGTPSTITGTSTNLADGTTHTHAIAVANTNQSGVVQLNNTLTSTSTSQALTAAQGKVLQDSKASNAVEVAVGVGLTGGGNLTTSRTISMGPPSTLNGNTTNSASGTTHTHAISAATESIRGVVELATVEETATGTDNTRAVHPAGLRVELNKISSKSTTIIAGSGLTGGGDLSTNRTISMGTPSTITGTSTNLADGTTHTHAIATGSTAQAGIVSLVDNLTSTSTTQALTANMGRTLDTTKASSLIDISAGSGLVGGGNLTASRSISMGAPSTITGGTTNLVSGTTHTHAIATGSTAQAGIVSLVDNLTSTSTTQALTANMGRTLDTTKVSTDTGITAGSGLTGGGTFNTTRTISMGQPSTITSSSGNTASGTTHSHAIMLASAVQKGIVELATAEEVFQNNSLNALTAASLELARSFNTGAGQPSWVKLPLGFVVQWGTQTVSLNSNSTVYFPVPHVDGYNTCTVMVTDGLDNLSQWANAKVISVLSDRFVLQNASDVSSAVFRWLSVGFYK